MSRPANADSEQCAAQVLCNLLASGCVDIRSTTFANQVALDKLINVGALVESGAVENVWCDACDAGHHATIQMEVDGGRLGWTCPDHGFIPAEIDAIRSYRLNIEKIAACLAKGLTPWTTQQFDIAPGLLWRLGRYAWRDKRVELLLVPRIDGLARLESVRGKANRIQRPDIGLVLIANAQRHRGMAIAEKYFAWPLNDVLTLDSSGELRIDTQELDAIVEQLLPLPAEARSGRPGNLECVRCAYHELLQSHPDIRGRNATARALHTRWDELCPGQPKPGLSTIKSHLTKIMK
jgi:hypothetical protein